MIRRLLSLLLVLSIGSLAAQGTAGAHDPSTIQAAAVTPSWSSGGPYGAYTYDLDIAPSDSNTIYAATDGGVFRSSDAALSWSGTGLTGVTVHSVAIDPGTANTVYAGTYDGVMKTTDGGTAWTALGPAEARVVALAIDPSNAATVYAAAWGSEDSAVLSGTNAGLFKSTDGGSTWTEKLGPNLDDIEGLNALLLDVDDPSRIYLGVHDYGAGVYISDDGGDTWSSEQLFSGWQETVALAMAPAGTDPARIYALESNYGSLYVSTDRGQSWANAGAPAAYVNFPWALAVDPSDANAIYVGTRNDVGTEGRLYRSRNGGSAWSVHNLPGLPDDFAFLPGTGDLLGGFLGSVQRSTDGGLTWQEAQTGLSGTYITGLAVGPNSPDGVLATLSGPEYPLVESANGGTTWTRVTQGPKWLGAVAIDPGDASTMWVGDDYRRRHQSFYVYRSTDSGGTWSASRFLWSSSYTATGVTDIVVSADSQCVLVGSNLMAVGDSLSGTGVLAASGNGGQSWSQVAGPTTALAADPNDATRFYSGKRAAGQVFAITDPCGTETLEELTPAGGIGDVRDMAVDSGSRLYVAASDGLWCRDGTTWARLSGLPTDDLTAVTVDLDASPDIVYVGTNGHGVFASDVAGATWVAFNAGLGNLDITELALGVGPTKVLYAGTAYGGVWGTSLGSAQAEPTPEPTAQPTPEPTGTTPPPGAGEITYVPLVLK